MKKKLMLIINPMAGRSTYKNGFADVLNLFSNGGYLTTTYFTEASGDATTFAALYAKNYDLVVCIGGDGTLSEVVSGLMQVKDPPRLGYIPLGSTNDVANTLSLPKGGVEAARRVLDGEARPFDIGGFNQNAYFTYVAAFGAFTDVAYATPQNEKRSLGYMAYMLHAAKALPKLESYSARVEYEDGAFEGSFLYGGMTNSKRMAGVIKIKPDLVDLADGVFEVLLVPNPKSVSNFTRAASGLLSQNYNGQDVIMLQSSDLKITFEKPVAWTRDGENGGEHQFVHLKNYPSAIQIIA